jgi:hypothetical protein
MDNNIELRHSYKRRKINVDQLLNNNFVSKTSFKKNKVTISKECGYKSTLLLKWNYENPCEQ